MPRLTVAFLALISLTLRFATLADDAKPAAQTRIMQGSVVDDKGCPVTSGRIYFTANDRRSAYLKEASAAIDATGHYRVELDKISTNGLKLSAAGLPLRYLLYAPGYLAGFGKIPPGNGPTIVNVQLIPAPWETVHFRLIDQNGHPVKEASVGAGFTPISDDEALELDEFGNGQVSMPPDRSVQIVASSPSHATTIVNLAPTKDAAAIFEVPMFNPIRGRVIDTRGQPITGVQIGSSVFSDGQTQELSRLVDVSTTIPTTTDAQGRFDLRLKFRPDSREGKFLARSWPFCFADESMRRLAFLRIDPHHIEPEYEVVLKPARPLRITLIHPLMTPSRELRSSWTMEPASSPDDVTSYEAMHGAVPPISGEGHRLVAAWPEGRYRLSIYSSPVDSQGSLDRINTEITVPPGEGPFILPPLHLQPAYYSGFISQPAPEIDASDLKTGQPVKLADFEGKVVVLTFWGSWFEPAVERMAQLMRLQESFKDEEVVFIALHDQSIQSREEFDRKLDGARRIDWNGRDLPFTVALDRPDPALPEDASPNGRGISIARYSIPALPVTLLIGRNGKVIGALNQLEHEETNMRINNALSRSD